MSLWGKLKFGNWRELCWSAVGSLGCWSVGWLAAFSSGNWIEVLPTACWSWGVDSSMVIMGLGVEVVCYFFTNVQGFGGGLLLVQ